MFQHMANWDDVRRIASELPGLEETPGKLEWRVRNKPVAWNRPLRRADLDALGDAAPVGTIIGVRVSDVAEQQALVQHGPDAVFVTPHFAGWPAVLVELDRIDREELEELIIDGWATQAPRRVVKEWAAQQGPEGE